MEQTISWDGLGSPVLELWAYPDNGSGSGHLSAYIRRISDGAVVYTIANYGADQHGPWRRHFVNIDSIPGLAGLKEARLVLEINTGNNGGFTGYFDDIALHEGVSPSTVTDLAAVSETSTDAIKLSWTAPGDDGSIGVLNNSTFTIQYATYTTVAWSTSSAQVEISTSGVAPGTSQYYTLDGLSANTSYYFRLWTKDSSANYSPLSNGATAATLTNPVTGTQVISVYFSGATVSWNALPVSPSSATCEGYILQASTSSTFIGTLYSSSTFAPINSTLTVIGLSPAAFYYFRVGALNWDGQANYTSPILARMPPDGCGQAMNVAKASLHTV